MSHVKAWDFSHAKGAAASVVDYDPKADLTKPRHTLESIRSFPTPERYPVPVEPRRRPIGELVRASGIPRADLLRVAYRLAAFDQRRTKPIPNDVRLIVSSFARRLGSDRLGDEILHGIHDDHLVELLP